MAYQEMRDELGGVLGMDSRLEDGKVLEVTFEAESFFGFCQD